MTPNERNLDTLSDFLEEKIKQLKIIQYRTCGRFEKDGTTTSDKLAIRKLRLKK